MNAILLPIMALPDSAIGSPLGSLFQTVREVQSATYIG
jgi:hypothetical protein